MTINVDGIVMNSNLTIKSDSNGHTVLQTISSCSAGAGTHSFIGIADGTYTVVPPLNGHTMTPATATATVTGGANVTGVNFVY